MSFELSHNCELLLCERERKRACVCVPVCVARNNVLESMITVIGNIERNVSFSLFVPLRLLSEIQIFSYCCCHIHTLSTHTQACQKKNIEWVDSLWLAYQQKKRISMIVLYFLVSVGNKKKTFCHWLQLNLNKIMMNKHSAKDRERETEIDAHTQNQAYHSHIYDTYDTRSLRSHSSNARILS